MNKILLSIFILSVSFISCKSKKVADKNVKPQLEHVPSANETLLKSLTLNENHFTYYNSRGSATVKEGSQSNDVNVEIVMEHEQYVYVNLTAFIGIPVARIWFTKDSICMVNNILRENTIYGYDYLSRMANVKLDLSKVQRALVGNILFVPEEDSVIADTVLQYIILNSSLSAQQTQSTYFKMADYKVSRSHVSDKRNGREFRVEYSECYTQGTNCYPKDFNINIRAEKNMECRINLDYFAFDKKKDVKFALPKNFKTTRM